MSSTDLYRIAEQFAFEGAIIAIKPLGEGFINDTYVVTTDDTAPDYILQRKNHHVFPDVPAMMQNIRTVTEHIKQRVADPLRETLTVIPARDGRLYVEADGNYWAACLYIKNTITYDRADTLQLARCGGQGIGRFQALLADFNTPLHETIRGFHNIRYRFEQWDETLRQDRVGRVSALAEEIGWIESRRTEIMHFWSLVEDGTIPRRVSHNDTKISNILFDSVTREALCVIDLDTVMSLTSLNDFGDAIRSYANTGAEDDVCLDNVVMSLDMFRAYAEGYLSEQRTLCAAELEWLAFAARYITYEQVLRFLMDYIDGDRYYKIAYAEHNLVRTRAQYRLLQSMESQYDAMCDIVRMLSCDLYR